MSFDRRAGMFVLPARLLIARQAPSHRKRAARREHGSWDRRALVAAMAVRERRRTHRHRERARRHRHRPAARRLGNNAQPHREPLTARARSGRPNRSRRMASAVRPSRRADSQLRGNTTRRGHRRARRRWLRDRSTQSSRERQRVSLEHSARAPPPTAELAPRNVANSGTKTTARNTRTHPHRRCALGVGSRPRSTAKPIEFELRQMARGIAR